MRAPFPTRLCDVLGIRHPVLLAGMAGGPTTPELVAAVSEAGGLGVFGATGMTADALAAAVRRARALTSRPIGVNVLLAPPSDGNPRPAEIQEFVAPFRRELGLEPPVPARAPKPSPALDLVQAALAEGADVVSVGLGDPAPVIEPARSAGTPVVAMVATVEDARRAVASGTDVVVAQGSEAGGHRSNFSVGPDGEVPLVGTLALVPQIVDAVDVPVVAAGGIMDGRGLVAALALGATGVQLGTAFLTVRESGASPLYRERVAGSGDTDTIVTARVTGRPARMLRSRLVDALAAEGPQPIGWPRQAPALADLRAEADRQHRGDLSVHLAGQAGALDRGMNRGAADVMADLISEAEAIRARL